MGDVVTIRSIATRIEETSGHASGFDYMRLALASAILLIHTALVCHGLPADQAIYTGPARPLARLILPAFFALSGFLVAGSLQRSRTLFMFLGLRALRIIPGLAGLTVFSAFILGPLVTDLPLRDYFGSAALRHYLLTAIGDVQFYLPGTFQANPLPEVVNGQLWTIPFELYSYIVISVLALLGLHRYHILAPLSVVTLTLVYLFVTLARHHWVVMFVPGSINGALLIATSLAGVSLYLYRDLVPWSFSLFLSAFFLACVSVSYLPFGDFLAPFPAAYATIYLGLLNPDRRFLHGADYSYGVYLYGFSVQQAMVHALTMAHEEIMIATLSVPMVLCVAGLSWYLIEKPAQKLRHILKKIEYIWFFSKAPYPIQGTTLLRPPDDPSFQRRD